MRKEATDPWHPRLFWQNLNSVKILPIFHTQNTRRYCIQLFKQQDWDLLIPFLLLYLLKLAALSLTPSPELLVFAGNDWNRSSLGGTNRNLHIFLIKTVKQTKEIYSIISCYEGFGVTWRPFRCSDYVDSTFDHCQVTRPLSFSSATFYLFVWECARKREKGGQTTNLSRKFNARLHLTKIAQRVNLLF